MLFPSPTAPRRHCAVISARRQALLEREEGEGTRRTARLLSPNLRFLLFASVVEGFSCLTGFGGSVCRTHFVSSVPGFGKLTHVMPRFLASSSLRRNSATNVRVQQRHAIILSAAAHPALRCHNALRLRESHHALAASCAFENVPRYLRWRGEVKSYAEASHFVINTIDASRC